MSFTNITDEELVGKGVTGLPDTPGLSTEDMQAQFDEYPAFLKDKFRTLISELEAVTGALNIGAVVPENITADGNIQSILDGLRQYVDDTVIALGTGDMATGIYDPNRDGVIAPAQGGTGQTSLQAARNAMGLGNTLEALPIENGGTGQTTVEGVRSVLGLGNTQGALPIANGGTGASTVEGARNALGLGNTSGALPIENGGTGQTTAAAARNALGLGNTSGALPVANGGTGANTAANARTNLDIYSKSETDIKLGTKANRSGATFTGQISLTNVTGSAGGISLSDNTNTRAIRLEATGTGAVAFKMGAPLKSSYGVMELGSANNSNGVHTYGSYLSVYNYAGSALVGVNASAFNVGSSRRYKQNIQNMTEEEAKKLLDVDVVTFDYKADSGIAVGDDRFNRQGVIAEDVNNICPDVVTSRIIDGEDLPDSVDYSKFVPRLIKMVQIQEMKIKELEAKL